MTRTLEAISMAIVLIAMAGAVSARAGFPAEPPMMSSPIQVIRPQIEILDRPVTIEVQIDPSLGVDTSMRILCATSTYRGEAHEDRQDTRIRLSVSGEIKELSPEKIFVSFDVEAQSEDVNGGRGFSGSGGAILEPGKPKTVLTIGGKSLILTVRVTPE